MSLDTSIAVAGSGLKAINQQFALISQNVSNANSPGYVSESAALSAVSAGGAGLGVVSGPAVRVLDQSVQAQLFVQNGALAYQNSMSTALAPIDQAMGTPGQANDLASMLGAVQSGFSTLLTDPSNQTQQQAIISNSQALASQVHNVASAIGAARQNAENSLVSSVADLNTNLTTIGKLNTQIVAAQSAGQSVADLQNQRDIAMQNVVQDVGAKFISQPDGSVLVYTPSGISLPTDGLNKVSINGATLGPNAYYPAGGIGGIMLGGSDITANLTGGQIGAAITLRDQTLPTLQAGLDEFAQNLSARFNAQGLALFSLPDGTQPVTSGSAAQAGYVGFSNVITVNPAVTANPSLVRDGTQAVAGSPTGASAFTPNPPGGPAGFTTLISRILNNALAADVQPGVAQPPLATNGLGPAGTLSLTYGPTATLGDAASAFTAAEASTSAAASSNLTNTQSLQGSLQKLLASGSAVSIDQQMGTLVALQNSYAANAKVISTMQAMWQVIQQMVV